MHRRKRIKSESDAINNGPPDDRRDFAIKFLWRKNWSEEELAEYLDDTRMLDSQQDTNWILIEAIKARQMRIIEHLVSAGIEIEPLDDTGKTVIHVAEDCMFHEASRLMLARCYNTMDRHELFYLACKHGDLERARNLLAAGGIDVNYRDPDDDDSETPLMAAACGRHEHLVKLLLRNRATDPNLGDGVGTTPLHGLLQEPIDVDLWDIEEADPVPNIIRLLCVRGCDVNATDSDDRSPLAILYEGFVNIVESQCRDVDRVKQCRDRQLQRLRSFLQWRPDSREIRDKSSVTPGGMALGRILHLVICSDLCEYHRNPLKPRAPLFQDHIGEVVVGMLLRSGADVDALDHRLDSPLQLAALRFNCQLVKELLAHKANVDSVTFQRSDFQPDSQELEFRLDSSIQLLVTIELLKQHNHRMTRDSQNAVLRYLWETLNIIRAKRIYSPEKPRESEDSLHIDSPAEKPDNEENENETKDTEGPLSAPGKPVLEMHRYFDASYSTFWDQVKPDRSDISMQSERKTAQVYHTAYNLIMRYFIHSALELAANKHLTLPQECSKKIIHHLSQEDAMTLCKAIYMRDFLRSFL